MEGQVSILALILYLLTNYLFVHLLPINKFTCYSVRFDFFKYTEHYVKIGHKVFTNCFEIFDYRDY